MLHSEPLSLRSPDVTFRLAHAVARLKLKTASRGLTDGPKGLDRIKTMSFGPRRNTFYDSVALDDPIYANEDAKSQSYLDALKKLSDELYAHDLQNLTTQERRKVDELRGEIRKIQHHYLQAKHPEFKDEEITKLDHPEKLTQISLDARARAQARVTQQERAATISLIQASRPKQSGVILSNLIHEELEKIAAPCREENRIIQGISETFSRLISLSESAKKHGYKVRIERKDAETFSIDTGDNLALSYSMFDLMRTIGRINGHEKFGGIKKNAAKFDREKNFQLSLSEVKELKQHLLRFEKFNKEFSLFFKEPLSRSQPENENIYTTIAQKPMSEITSEDLSEEAEKDFRSKEDQAKPVLLFSSLGITLDTHPQRERLKASFEKIYADLGFIGRNGKPKTFIIEDPYRSNLNPQQVIDMSPQLTSLIIADRLLGKLHPEKDPASATISERLKVLVDHQADDILMLAKRINPEQTEACTLYKIVYSQEGHLKKGYTDIGWLKERGGKSFGALTKETNTLYDVVLNYFANTKFDRKNPCPQLTRDMKQELYDERIKHPAFDNTNKTSVDAMFTQVNQLFEKLKNSEPYLSALKSEPFLADSLKGLHTEFRYRLFGGNEITEYDQLPNMGPNSRKMVRDALSSFESLVGKIVYREQLKISSEKVSECLRRLAGQDNGRFCATGFFGRIEYPFNALISETDDVLEQAVREFKVDRVNEVFHKMFVNNTESAMAIIPLTRVMRDLGLQDADYKTPPDSKLIPYSDYNTRALQSEAEKNMKPGDIHKHLCKFFEEEIWNAISERDDNTVCSFLRLLKFDQGDSSHEFQKYRVSGDPEASFQLAYIRGDLPKQVALAMIGRESPLIESKKRDFVPQRPREHKAEEAVGPQRLGANLRFTTFTNWIAPKITPNLPTQEGATGKPTTGVG